MSNLRKLYLLNELSDLCFLLHISSHPNEENNREKFKENLTTTSITKESPYATTTTTRSKVNVTAQARTKNFVVVFSLTT